MGVTLPRVGFVQPVEGVSGGIPIPVVVGGNASSFATGQKNVTSPGTAVNLPAQAVFAGGSVAIVAKKDNAKKIFLGNSKVNAENHALADILNPGDSRRLQITDWSLVWIDGEQAGDGVTIISET